MCYQLFFSAFVWIDIAPKQFLHEVFHEKFLFEEDFVVIAGLKSELQVRNGMCMPRGPVLLLGARYSIGRKNLTNVAATTRYALIHFVRILVCEANHFITGHPLSLASVD